MLQVIKQNTNDKITHTQNERQKSQENNSEINFGARICIFSLYPNLSVSRMAKVANNAIISVANTNAIIRIPPDTLLYPQFSTLRMAASRTVCLPLSMRIP